MASLYLTLSGAACCVAQLCLSSRILTFYRKTSLGAVPHAVVSTVVPYAILPALLGLALVPMAPMVNTLLSCSTYVHNAFLVAGIASILAA